MGSLKIPHSFIQELLSRVDIVEVISSYLTLKQVGRNFTALCPFHPEKTPSFVVSPEKQIFKCFGCGVGGNAITFVEKYENLTFYEAVKRLAEIAGMELPSSFSSNQFDKLEEAGIEAAEFFHSKLPEVSEYLESRRIGERECKRFLLGYAPQNYIKELNLDREALKELGLINDRGKEFFSKRLIIPIFNHSGKVVAFAGRLLEKSDLPKYINSPESSIFKKGSTLFGFYQARDSILREKKVVIVEGYFDVISLHQCGIKTAVAPMGTSLTESHAKIIRRYTEFPILAFDGDNAGRKATVRSAGIFLQLGLEPFVCQLPEGEDPDSLSKENPELLKQLVESPTPFIDWCIAVGKSLPDDEASVFLKELSPAIAPLEDSNPFLYKEYLAKLTAEFGIGEKWIKANTPKYRRKEESKEPEEPIPLHEKIFLKAFLEGKAEIPLDISPNVFLSNLVSKTYAILKNAETTDITSLQLEFPELSGLLSELALTEFSDEEIKLSVCRVCSKELERRLKRANGLKEKALIKQKIFELKKGNLSAIAGVENK